MTATEVYLSSFKEGLKPTETLTVSEWADKYRIIPREGGAKEPGRWRTSRAPCLREIMDNLSASNPTNFTVVQKGTQLGFTEAGINFFGYTVHIDPAPMMMLLPTIEVAKRHSKSKIKNTISQTPCLKERIPEARERDSGNTTLMKEFPGGSLIIAGANSAASLRNLSIKKLILDEVDAYEPDLESEGDTISLALKRTDAFGLYKKVLIISTPTVKNVSNIEKEFENSDQRHYYVPCPYCGHMQHLKWQNITFTHEEYRLKGDVTYKCESCSELIHEYSKTSMFQNGQWIAHNPGHKRRGYKLPSFYSPLGFLSWSEIVEEFLEAKKNNDFEKLKTWVNTRLAETWDESREPHINVDSFYARREKYGMIVPLPALLLTCGADVQDDRIEAEIKAWGLGEESWTMDYKVIYGNPAQKGVWSQLDDYIKAPFLHASGIEINISGACIDSGGHFTQETYDFVRPRQYRRVYATKGSQFPGRPIVERSKRINQGRIRLVMIGTDTAKDTILARLQIERKPRIETEFYKPLTDEPVEVIPMYMHFNDSCDEEYFKQLVSSEQPEKVKQRGRIKRVYKQIRERNEALDTNVLNLAALRILKPDYKKIIEWMSKKKQLLKVSADVKDSHETKDLKQEELKRINPPAETRRKGPANKIRPWGMGKNWIKGWK